MISLFYACIYCTSSVGSGSTHGATWSYIAAIPGASQVTVPSHPGFTPLERAIAQLDQPRSRAVLIGDRHTLCLHTRDLATQTTRTNPAMPKDEMAVTPRQ
jgi:hypothetical protein